MGMTDDMSGVYVPIEQIDILRPNKRMNRH